jgi:hypothetical protein
MARVTLYVTKREFEHFLKGNAFEGRTSRQYDTDIEVHVPRSAIKECKDIYNFGLTVYVYETDQW